MEKFKHCFITFLHQYNPIKMQPLLSVYETACVSFFWGHSWCFLRGVTVSQLWVSNSDRSWHLGLPPALHRPPTFSSSISLTLSENVPSSRSRTPEEEMISSLSQPDSGAYYKPKDLIFYNRLHCGSRRGSSYFFINSPQLEDGASCVFLSQ